MKEYQSKEDLITEIELAANLFIAEFSSVNEANKDQMMAGVDRTPAQMIAYQLGWLDLMMQWDIDEREGKDVVTPSPDYKWNKLGDLYESFYADYSSCSLRELEDMFEKSAAKTIIWINTFSEYELFEQDVRKWASSTPSRWPIWKWIHINTVAPFKTFRSKIRKWKKLNTETQAVFTSMNK